MAVIIQFENAGASDEIFKQKANVDHFFPS
jgi:hypothetical protein